MNKRLAKCGIILLIISLLFSTITFDVGAVNNDLDYDIITVLDKTTNRADPWELMDTITTTVQIDAGDRFYIKFENETLKLKAMTTTKLAAECDQALSLIPEWLRGNLSYKFSQLSSSDQVTYANLIINSPDPKYRDEIAFCIAHSSVEALEYQYMFPQMFTDNAKFIYENDQYLDYVDIVEKNDHTTLSYKNQTNVSLEVPRDIYYWTVVHPKLSDEFPTYVDPDYDYSTQSPFDRNYGRAPPNGKFWRDWLFNFNDTGANYSGPHTSSRYKPNPLLKDLLMNSSTVWEAISAVSHWVVDSMIFDSDNTAPVERPIQPVRIYRLHMGRCGEHQDIACAGARAALIPTVCTSNSGEDHVWNEFWDQRWVHWDANGKDIMDRKHSHDKDYSGNKDLSSVWSSRGDGHVYSATSEYTPTCSFTATVLDANDLPVDGAQVLIATENYYEPTQLTITTWGYTNYSGKCEFDLGNVRNYWSRIETDNLGEAPPDSGGNDQVTQVITKAVANNNYKHTFSLPNPASKLAVDEVVGAKPDQDYQYKMEISYDVLSNILQGKNLYTGEHCDLYGTGGNIDFTMVDSKNFTKYNNSETFSAFALEERKSSNELSIATLLDDNFYAILSNEFSQKSTKTVNITVKIYGTLFAEISEPKDGSELNLESTITISGKSFSPVGVSNVEIDIDNQDSWQQAVDTSGSKSSAWNTWKFDWDTKGLAPGKHLIKIRATDGSSSFIDTINLTLIGVTRPKIDIEHPLDNSTYRIGELIDVYGSAEDNVDVTEIIFILDNDEKNATNIISSLKNDRWSYRLDSNEIEDGLHYIEIQVYDQENNYNSSKIRIKLLEVVAPEVSIVEPLNNSVFKLGDTITIKGTAVDNKDIDLLELKIDNNESINLTSKLKSNGEWRYRWDTSTTLGGSLVKDGTHIITISAIDAVQNFGYQSVYLILDGIEPSVNTISPIENEIYKAGEKVIVTGNASDNIGIASMEISIDDGKYIDITDKLSKGFWQYKEWDTDDLLTGEHSITIKVIDLMGFINYSTTYIIIDAENPFVLINEIKGPTMVGDEIVLNGRAEDDISINAIELQIGIDQSINITPYFSKENGTWSYILNTSDLNPGTIVVVIEAIDIVSNKATDEMQFQLISLKTDSDNDGMPDWWELQYEKLDPSKDDADKDFDRDGFSNLDEYLGDDKLPDNVDYSDPMDGTSTPKVKEEKAAKDESSLGELVIIAVIVIIVILIIFFIIAKKKRTSKESFEDQKQKETMPEEKDKKPEIPKQPIQPGPIPTTGFCPKPGQIPAGVKPTATDATPKSQGTPQIKPKMQGPGKLPFPPPPMMFPFPPPIPPQPGKSATPMKPGQQKQMPVSPPGPIPPPGFGYTAPMPNQGFVYQSEGAGPQVKPKTETKDNKK